MHGRRRLVIPVLLLVVALGAAAWYLGRPPAEAAGALAATGTIEATTVAIGPEIAGRVVEVAVEEGERVGAGALLVRLDDTLLRAQRSQAEAGVAVAQAGLAGAQAAVDAADAGVAGAEAAVARAEAGVAAAQSAVGQARAALRLSRAGASGAQVDVARRQVDQARTAWQGARDAYAALSSTERRTPAGRTAKAQRDTARAALATAEAQYRLVRAGSRSQQVDAARDAVDAARAQVVAARAQVDAARAQADAARAQARGAQAQADAAAAQLDAATAGLAVVDAQLARTAIAAPSDGTLLARMVEPGAVVAPGAALLELGDLDRLTLTVFVPEDRYGQVRLGQPVEVTVDSFPGTTFSGQVRRIADSAEFTPRNVQTVEGRASTVFAIDLALDPSEGRLKPGMPADVTFR